MMIRFSATY